MLEGLRANKGGIITWIFLGAIIVVFVISFGPGSLTKGGGGCGGAGAAYAARVNGKTIPALEWERQYGQLYNLYQSQMGGGFTRELADQLGVAEQALSQLVDRELVIQEAKRRGIVVSDEELSSAVHAIPAFQQNGAFHFESYEASARQNFGSPAKFEAWYRDQLLYGKMLSAIGETVKVSDAEVKEAWQLRRRQDRAHLRPVPLLGVPGRGEAVRRGREGVRRQGGSADRAVLQGEPGALRPEEEGPRRATSSRAWRPAETRPPRRRRSRTPPPA